MTETEDYDKSATPTAHKTTHQDGGSDEINVAALSGLLGDGQTPLAHKTSHQDGGSDEISVSALFGILADDQHVLDAEAVSAMGAKANTNPLNHDRYADSEALAAAVQAGAITDGVTKAPTHDAVYDVKVMTEDHSARHEDGGLDEISVAGLSGTLADAQTPAAHKTSHQDGGSDEISVQGLSGLLADDQHVLDTEVTTVIQSYFQKCRCYLNAAQTITKSTWSKLLIDTDSFDPANISDLTNNRIIPTKAGYYIVSGQITYLSMNALAFETIAIRVNNSEKSRGLNSIPPIAGTIIITVLDVVYLDGVDDYVELWTWHNSADDEALYTGLSHLNYLSIAGPF